MQVTTATEAYLQNQAEALSLLAEIEDLLVDLPMPGFEDFAPNWGHAAGLELVIRQLREVREGMIWI